MRGKLTLIATSFSLLLFGGSFATHGPSGLSEPFELSPEGRELLTIAGALERQGRFGDAGRAAEAALAANRRPLPKVTADKIRLEIARLYETGESPEDAIRVLRTILRDAPSSPKENEQRGMAAYNLAWLLFKQGLVKDASHELRRGEAIARGIDHPRLLASILALGGEIHSKMGDYPAAIRALTEALTIVDTSPPTQPAPAKIRLSILWDLASAYRQHNQYSQAEAVILEYLKQAEALGDPAREAEALFLRGELRHRQGQLLAAVDDFFAAARKASEQLDRPKAMQYFRVGLAVLEELQDYDRMKAALLVALARYKQVFEDKADKANLLTLLGQVCVKLGEYDTAHGHLFDAYELYRDLGDDTEAARNLIQLVGMMSSLEDQARAFRYLRLAEEHATRAGNRDALAVIYKKLGVLYTDAGRLVDAFGELEKARAIYGAMGRRDLLFSVEHLITRLLAKMHDQDKMREQLQRLHAYRIDDRSLEKDHLYWAGLSLLYAELGERAKAKEYASRGLGLAREAKDFEQQIDLLAWLAALSGGNEAITLLEEANSIAEKTGARWRYAHLHDQLGHRLLRQGLIRKAIEAFNISISATETMVGRVPFSDTRVYFTARSLSPYDGLIEALYLLYNRHGSRDLAEKALLVHERSRAQEFGRLLTTTRFERIAERLPPEVYEEEQKLANEIDRLEREVYALSYAYDPDEQLLSNREEELKSRRERYALLMKTIEGRYPQYAITRRRDLGSVSALPVGRSEAILVYRKTPAGLFLWTITNRDGAASVRLFLKVDGDLGMAVRKAMQGFGRNDPASPSREALAFLSDKLLKPAARGISGASELTVVPDGILTLLPLEMLPTPDNPHLLVLDRWTVTYYPSLLSMVVNRSSKDSSRHAAAKVLLVGDAVYQGGVGNEGIAVGGERGAQLRSGSFLAELPYSGREINSVSQIFAAHQAATTVLTRKVASESEIKRLELREYKYLHFAVHGLQPYEILGIAEPSLAFSLPDSGQDGFLTASEIVGLRLRAELVVLSACRTAMGPYYAGEGRINLARAFMIIGAKGVIVSQWAVADESTAELMVEMYRNLASGVSAPEALRAAKRSLRVRYPSPYYWAPFVLVGG